VAPLARRADGRARRRADHQSGQLARPGDEHRSTKLAVDATHVHWTLGNAVGATQAVMRAPKAGGTAETLDTGRATGAIVLDARSVSWSAEHALVGLDK
jgi:hypothetical protein